MIQAIHRGQYLQRGRGLGGIFSSIMRVLKPIFTKSVSLGKKALSDPSVQKAVSSLKKNSIKAGTRVLNKEMGKIAPTPKDPNPPAKIIKYVRTKKRKNMSNTIKKTKKKKTAANNGQNLFNAF